MHGDSLTAPASGGNLIVYGHHPLYSSGTHGDNQILIDRLQPLLAVNRADLYLAGHDHNIEIRKTLDGINQVVSGAGGKLRDIAESGDPQTLYAASIGNLHLDGPGFPRSV